MVVKNFTIDELVCPHVFKLHGEVAWNWIDPRLAEWLGWFREAINKPVYVNWPEKKLTQRGLRCNLCQLVKDKTTKNKAYNSSHIRFQALDFTVGGMTDAEVRMWLIKNMAKMPVNIRMEADTEGWTHIDVCNGTKDKIHIFKG